MRVVITGQASQIGATPGRTGRVLLDAGNPVATGSVLRTDHRSARIGRVLVDPRRRGEGLGRALVQGIIEDVESSLTVDVIRLGVYEHNTVARDLYESLGFEVSSGPPRETVDRDGALWVSIEMELHVSV